MERGERRYKMVDKWKTVNIPEQTHAVLKRHVKKQPRPRPTLGEFLVALAKSGEVPEWLR